jgi:hypothetical protein
MSAIPVIWEVEIGGLWLKERLGKKLLRLYLKKQAWCGCTTCNPCYVEGRFRRISF